MPRQGYKMKAVSVYATEEQAAALQAAADAENRSLSNFLLVEGLERAKELGYEPGKKSRKRSA
jgi:uncharacterized protein (DUF1778 family)